MEYVKVFQKVILPEVLKFIPQYVFTGSFCLILSALTP